MNSAPKLLKDGILVVDDDSRILQFISQLLALAGYPRNYRAETLAEAQAVWKEHRNKIWLLITDFVMPEATGDVLALQLLEQQPNLQVLFISGNDPLNLKSSVPLLPRKNFLQKPFMMQDLKQMIENAKANIPKNPAPEPVEVTERMIPFPAA